MAGYEGLAEVHIEVVKLDYSCLLRWLYSSDCVL